ncbi:MAG: SAM-dependent methyltransferase [Thermomicrobiales bacterium]|nr:SAM-dependent methyltransferase [Thermomicrobiales bacterium]
MGRAPAVPAADRPSSRRYHSPGDNRDRYLTIAASNPTRSDAIAACKEPVLDESHPRTGHHPELLAAIRDEIAAAGRITFARFMELALYHPDHGYYLAAERRPGRGGDFLTAPEASAYFGLTLSRQIAECWERLGRPAPFVIREYGSGVGVLAYDIIAGLSEAAPDVMRSLRYRLVEPNRHRLEQALDAMAELELGEIVAGETIPSGSDAEPIVGVVLANEVADALPVHRLIVRDGRLVERYVVWNDGLAEEEGPLSPAVAHYPDTFANAGIVLVEGGAYDISPAAAEWFASVARGLRRGYAIVIDYGYPAHELFQRHRLEGTVRGYFEHAVTDDPFVRVGRQDLTAHVDFSALQAAGEAEGMTLAGFTTQGALLASLGLGERLTALQRDPDAALGDYLSAQAVVMRLIDPGGLGRFGVLLMAKDAPVAPPLLGLSTRPPSF